MELTLRQTRDWIKNVFEAEHYYIGRLDGKYDRSLGVYAGKGRGRPRTALGGTRAASYGVKPVTLLLHWTRNAGETEEAALALWDALRAHRAGDGEAVLFAAPSVPAPVPVGTDPDGVYEYVIDMNIYYRRNG